LILPYFHFTPAPLTLLASIDYHAIAIYAIFSSMPPFSFIAE